MYKQILNKLIQTSTPEKLQAITETLDKKNPKTDILNIVDLLTVKQIQQLSSQSLEELLGVSSNQEDNAIILKIFKYSIDKIEAINKTLGKISSQDTSDVIHILEANQIKQLSSKQLDNMLKSLCMKMKEKEQNDAKRTIQSINNHLFA